MSDIIEDLTYIMQQAKKYNKPKPIVFLGAEASVTGNIPLSNQIVKDILVKYKDKPKIKRLAAGYYPKVRFTQHPLAWVLAK